MSRYVCCHERRLQAVKEAGALNGVEYVEVRDSDEPVQALKQRTLYVRLLRPVPPFTGDNVVIDGGDRIRTVAVTWAAPATALPVSVPAAEQSALLAGLDEPDHVLVVRTEARGDFSRYTLHLVGGGATSAPPAGFDPLLVDVEFSFKVECPSDFDCAPAEQCPPDQLATPPVDYLAKDYQGFRRLMLSRMALLAPGWTERNPADVGVTLVELMAYVADELSYRQDAVATEAFLGTARSRVSLRRHARLVDYRVHEGCNARTWVQLDVDSPTVTVPAHTQLLTSVPGLDPQFAPHSHEHDTALAAEPVVFETVEPAVLHAGLGTLHFYTWGEQRCCLPSGATAATLRDAHPRLRAGDVLILAETVSPTTGDQADADPAKRWAVRLVDVRLSTDPSGGLFATPPTSSAVDVTEIRWHDSDALPFPLCVSDDGDVDTAVAWGNLVLADHGATIADEDLGAVPPPHLACLRPGTACGDPVRDDVPARYRPALAQRPLTQAVARPAPVAFESPLTAPMLSELSALTFGPALQELVEAHDLPLPPATAALHGADPLWSLGDGITTVRLYDDGGVLRASLDPPAASTATAPRPSDALPAIELVGELDSVADRWMPKPDLLASASDAREFTVETEHDGTALLRFGDDEHGMRPDEGTSFTATYRIGSGVSGNIGAESLAHVVTTATGIVGVRNPLPAAGGVDPESAEQVRRDAPQAFAVQERAVTEADYGTVAERHQSVQRAAATMRWTGSWHTVFVTADRLGGAPVDATFETDLRSHLERYRMAGYDLDVDAPRFVPLDIAVRVCAAPGHYRSGVAAAVLDVLSDRTLPDGRRGLFHPDGLTFGQSVHLSSVYAAVHSVPGVESAVVEVFQRQRDASSSGLDDGVLPMGRLEIPRLDNDPNFPERGTLEVTVGGGL